MTGTPLDLTSFGMVLKGIGLLYWLLVIGVIALVLVKVRGWLTRVLAVAAVITIMVGPVARDVIQKQRQQQRAKAKLDAAMAHFNMRCKSAGEKIFSTADDVAGILLMKIRPAEMNYSDQFRLDDPYGRNCGGKNCIASYLFDGRMVPDRPGPNASLRPSNARLYDYVDVIDETTSQRFRYTKDSPHAPLKRTITSENPPRYGVTWEDISTPEDRQFWVAGGSLKIVDLETNDVIAERRGYLLDRGQGSTAGFRSPWTWARASSNVCPLVAGHNEAFVLKILRLKGGK
ncbi:MAG: hypothetical protein JWR25_1331 [Noviherbaspirillum sp.]|nr:hypothetical protein [Noviherbaspirillum sp.]